MTKNDKIKTKGIFTIAVSSLLIFSLAACTNTNNREEDTTTAIESSSQDAISKEQSEQTDALHEEETSEISTDSTSDNNISSETTQENLGTAQYLKDIDWEAFQTRISDDESQVVQKYLPVLQGEEFVWIYRSGEGEETDTYIHAQRQLTIQDMVTSEMEGYGEESVEPVVDSIIFADVFQSGKKDMAVLLTYGGWNWLILHEENGIVYGIDMPVRWFEGVQEDGLYFGSGGAGLSYYYRMKFANGDYTEESVGDVISGELYINDEKQSDEKYQTWMKENIKEEVKWYAPVE